MSVGSDQDLTSNKFVICGFSDEPVLKRQKLHPKVTVHVVHASFVDTNLFAD